MINRRISAPPRGSQPVGIVVPFVRTQLELPVVSMYQRILVPTDGSEAAEAAVDQATDLAKLAGATIHALFVIELPASSPMQIDLGDITNRLETRGDEVTSDVEQRADNAGVEAVTSVRTGNADREIVDYASEEDIDLIVMGTHGRRGIERHLLGSVTERVVRTSPVPVLTARPANVDK